MDDTDYTPVYSDEDDLRRRMGGDYPPVPAPIVAASGSPAAPAGYPPVGSTEDLESKAAHPAIAAMPPVQPQAPKWSDYAPAQPHGWGKFKSILAAFNPISNALVNVKPQMEAKRNYANATGEFERGQKQESDEALNEQRATEAEKNRAAAENLRNPAPKAPKTAFDLWQEQNQGHPVSEFYKMQQDVKPEKPDKPDTPEQQFIDEETSRHIPLAKAIADYAAAAHPERPDAEDQRGERSYQATVRRVDALRKPVEERLERLGRLEDTLNQGTPQADALVAPELLSVMAGGQASGLRMNEAEISRIVGGRTNWEALKAAIGKWQMDPNKGFAITPDQRKQIRALFDTVKQRAGAKMQAIEEESQNLAESNDPMAHRSIYNRLSKRMGDIDLGGAQGAPAGNATAPAAEYKPGLVRNGFRFKGGDPTNKENWEKAQ